MPTDKLTLLVLEMFADINSGRVIGPSGPNFTVKDLSALVGVKDRQQRKILTKLERDGYLRIERHRRAAQGSTFWLTQPGASGTPVPEGMHSSAGASGTPVPEGMHSSAYDVTPRHPNVTPILPGIGDSISENGATEIPATVPVENGHHEKQSGAAALSGREIAVLRKIAAGDTPGAALARADLEQAGLSIEGDDYGQQ